MGPTRPLISKIAPPELPKVVWRDALFETLDRKAHYSVTWISGMAGAGKTTLVASYLKSRKLPFIWYRVDAGDCDLPTFFHYLAQAVKKASPRKRKPLPHLTSEYLHGAAVFAVRFFENVSFRLPRPFCIVFDDFQNVDSFPLFHDVFKEGLMNLSRRIHVLIASRSDPPPGLVAMMAANRMRVIDAHRLRLTLGETRAIYRLETDCPLSSAAARPLHETSGGWAAGIVLMAKSLRHEQWSATKPASVMPPTIFDYFSSELFAKWEMAVRDFLLQTAFLPRMTAAMANALTGNAEAGRILACLQRKNMFTEKSSDNPPTYQYHALFHRFLMAKARDTLGAKAVTDLERRAAQVLREAGLVEEAALRLIDVGDMLNLVLLLHEHGMPLIHQGRHRPLANWLDNISGPVLNRHPWLLYWRGAARQPDDAEGAGRDFVAAFDQFDRTNDGRGLLLSWTGIVGSIVNEWDDFHALDPWIDWLERWIETSGAYPTPLIEARVAYAMAVAVLIRRPAAVAGNQWFQKALSLARQCNDVDLELQVIGWAMTFQAWMGRYDEVEVIRRTSKTLAQSRRAQPPFVVQWKWIDIATRLCTMRGRESILNEVADAIALVRKTGLYTWEHRFLMPGIFAALLVSDFKTAKVFLRRFEAVLNTAHYHAHAIYHHFAGLYELLSGDLIQASAHAETAVRVADETGYLLACVICRIQRAYVLHLKGASDQALKVLQPAGDMIRQCRSAVLEFMEMMVRAKMAYDLGDDRGGLVFLERAFGLGRRHHFLTLVWWWHPDLIGYLCGQALARGVETDYVKKLIRTHRLAPDPQFADFEDWPRALQVKTFDTFQLLRDGEPMRFSGKVQKRPLELLKFLIAWGGQEVALDSITDTLWPDADGDMAHSAFSSALNRLRKLIGVKEAILLTDGKVSLDPRHIWVDALGFETNFRKANALKGNAKDQERLVWCEKAIESYGGLFLKGDNGTSWIIATRERLKNMFLEALKTAGRQREAAGDYDQAIAWYQKGMSTDPLEENFYQRLMACHYRQNNYSQAVKVYKQCREMLKNHFDVAPAKATEDLYRRLQQTDEAMV